MHSKKMLISLIPWILFTVIAGHAGANPVGWAAAITGLLALGIAVTGITQRKVDGSRSSLKVVDATGIVTFAGTAALAFTGSPGLRQDIVDYGRGACALILAIVMLGSLLIIPFSEQYARESVPRAYWHSPIFRSINHHVSAAFGIAVLLMSVGHFYSGYLDSHGGTSTTTNLVLNWVIPVLVILAALIYTDRLVTVTDKRSAADSRTA
jgi:hypothetical protein